VVAEALNLEKLSKCFVMEAFNFCNLCWGVDLRFGGVEKDGLDDLGIDPELESLRYKWVSKEWINCLEGGGGLRTTKFDV
jgi:hypothetical protein